MSNLEESVEFRLVYPTNYKKTKVKFRDDTLVIEYLPTKFCRHKKPLIIPFDFLLSVETKASDNTKHESISFLETDLRFLGNGTKNTQKVFDKVLEVRGIFLTY